MFWNPEIAAASLEIIIMLLGAFFLWIMFHWSLIPRLSGPKEDAVVELVKEDDLQLIEGIGPVTEKYLHKHDIFSYKDIFSLHVQDLEELIEKWWNKLATTSVTTWPDQAKLAHDKKWSELEEYQEILGKSKKKRK